uniref:Uncharacterized protein n=1 Tax=Physcomitrium patens TaxID=3218 RepID=A0A7I4EQE4_PHYPA
MKNLSSTFATRAQWRRYPLLRPLGGPAKHIVEGWCRWVTLPSFRHGDLQATVMVSQRVASISLFQLLGPSMKLDAIKDFFFLSQTQPSCEEQIRKDALRLTAMPSESAITPPRSRIWLSAWT